MKQLIDAVGHSNIVAVSRLSRPGITEAIVAAGIEVIEVPHVRCRPVPYAVGPATTRVRSWPNLGGFLEDGDHDDVVVWDRSLAQAPPNGTVVVRGSDDGDPRERTSELRRIVKRMEQIRGVSACRPTTSPRAILYTQGADLRAIGHVQRAFPGAMGVTPAPLREFPGGVVLTLTREAWIGRQAYADTVEAALDHHMPRESDVE